MSINKKTHPERAVLMGSGVSMLLRRYYFSFNHQNIPIVFYKITYFSAMEDSIIVRLTACCQHIFLHYLMILAINVLSLQPIVYDNP